MSSPCPDRCVLERFILGKVSAPEVEQVEAHVQTCRRCGDLLASLPTGAEWQSGEVDLLIAAMRQSVPALDAAEAELIQAIVPWLKRLKPRELTQSELSGADLEETGIHAEDHGTPPPSATLATFDFLASPQSPGEMGRLGSFRVIAPLGAGGMGMVFLGEDPRLQRQVALKVIKPELVSRPEVRDRFLAEARAIAAIEHDNIVAILQVDEERGVPFLAMPLLRGQSLEERLREADGPLAVDDILRIGREIAQGLAAAHERNLIHRDIKPGNIWLDATANGRVKILDFGLARLSNSGAVATPGGQSGESEKSQARSISGTPAFMAPEQAQGQEVDGRADLFSLGCVLYRLATGRPAFRGDTLFSTLLSVTTSQPTLPRQLNTELPPALEELIVQLLAKKVIDRPASAQAVVEVLGAIEAARAEAARPKPSRRPWLLLTAAAVGGAVLVATAVTAWLLPPQRQPLPPPGEIVFACDEPGLRLALQREDEEETIIDLVGERKVTLPPGDYHIRPVEEKSDRTLVPNHVLVKAGETARLTLRLVGEIRQHRLHTLTVWGVALSPWKDSLLALSASNDRSIVLWDAGSDAAPYVLGEHASPVRCLAFAPDGRRAASGSGDRGKRADMSIRLWDVEKRTQVGRLEGHDSWVTAVAFAPDGRRLLSGGIDGALLLWDLDTGKPAPPMAGHDRLRIHAVTFSPDGKQALSGGGDKVAILWDIAKRQLVRALKGHADAVTGVAFGPGGQEVVTVSMDGSLRVWETKGDKVREVQAHPGGVLAVAWSPDGKRLLTGGADGKVRLWDAATLDAIYDLLGHHGSVNGVAFAMDGHRALSGGADRTVRLWELPEN